MEILVQKNLKMPKPLIDQYFCHYEVLEEYLAGMWRAPKSGDRIELEANARSFMSDTERFAAAMRKVCAEWANSCAYNFTNPSTNSVAWLGQAAVCEAVGLPESVTRAAWSQLSEASQIKANAAARLAISEWYESNANSDQMDFFDGP